MLKQSPGRNQRSKGFKVKHFLQICLLLAISLWLLNQLKHSLGKKNVYDDSSEKIPEEVQNKHEILKLGRKGMHPGVESALEIETQGDKMDLEEGIEEIKPEETEDDGQGGGDDEIDGHDQERSEEEESEEVEDLIDVDDKVKEEGNEDVSSLDDIAQSEGERNLREAREEYYMGDDTSSFVAQNNQTMNAEYEVGGLSKVKEKDVAYTEDVEFEQENKSRSVKEVPVDIIVSDREVGNKASAENGVHENDNRKMERFRLF